MTYWPLCVQSNKSDIVQSSMETRGPDSDIEMAGAATGTVLQFQDINKPVSGLQTLKRVFILNFLLKYCRIICLKNNNSCSVSVRFS